MVQTRYNSIAAILLPFTIFTIGLLVLKPINQNTSQSYVEAEKSLFNGTGSIIFMNGTANLNVRVSETHGGLGKLFLFVDDQNRIIDSLAVENINIEGPDYRIISGEKHDWLAVRTINQSGTGYIMHKEILYTINDHGNVQELLSYPVDGFINTMSDYNDKELSTEIIPSDNESSITATFTVRTCSSSIPCESVKRTVFYVQETGSDGKMSFIIDPTRSEITEEQIDNLI